MPRLFTAVELAPGPRQLLAGVIPPGDAEDDVLGGKWVAPEKLHVTLRFLGSVAPEAVAHIDAALKAVAGGPPFQLALAGLGLFPTRASARTARVLWAGVTPHPPLAALKEAIDASLGPDPEATARGYSPHVTLARLPHTRGIPLAAYLDKHAALSSPPWLVETFALYESRTLPGGAEYRRIACYPLRPKP